MTYSMIHTHTHTWREKCSIFGEMRIAGENRDERGYAVFEIFESISNNKIVFGRFICMKCEQKPVCITLLDFNSYHNQHPKFSNVRRP